MQRERQGDVFVTISKQPTSCTGEITLDFAAQITDHKLNQLNFGPLSSVNVAPAYFVFPHLAPQKSVSMQVNTAVQVSGTSYGWRGGVKVNSSSNLVAFTFEILLISIYVSPSPPFL